MKPLQFVALASASLIAACGVAEDNEPSADATDAGSTPPQRAADGESPSPASALIQSGTLIELDDGALRGVVNRGARSFLGIPYAAPPVGDRRWKPPAPVEPWSGERAANAFGAPCAQTAWIQGLPEGSLEEDCLFLNVWTPELAPSEPLAVMVWMPGGGNDNGSAADLSPLTGGTVIYDGTDLAATENVVVVTINYRLGPFGFFSHPGLRDDGSPSGNQGLQDQQAALRWVRSNIIAFGGDPNNVTLFGESAGSQDTCLHVVSPGAEGLFHRAISQSGGCLTAKGTRDAAEAEGMALAGRLGCDGATGSLACLRERSVQEILDAGGSFNPIVDGEVIPEQPRTLVETGRFAQVPYLLGANFEEGTLFLLASSPVQDEQAYLAALEAQFGAAASDVAALYPASAFPSPQDALIRVRTDSGMVCSTHDTARRVAAQGVPTYLYNFSRSLPGPIGELLGPTHGVEMPYIFGTVQDPGPEDQALSDLMQGYWTHFARTGDPNGTGGLEWPRFEAATMSVMSFDASSEIVPSFRREECDFWAAMYASTFP